MAYNKVMDRVGNILLDLSSDTVTEKDVRFGKTFHDSSGNVKQGILDPTVMEIVDSDIPMFDLSKVNFIDTHTGELIASYTIEEAKNLAELPPLPNHPEEDLIGDGWSEDLDTLQTISQGLLVGCYYKTGEDYSMYEILVTEDNFTLTLKPNITSVSSTGTSTFKVDWGDGEITENEVTSTITLTLTHTYEKSGVYRLKLYYDETFYDYNNKMVSEPHIVTRIYSSTHQWSVSLESKNIREVLYPKYLYENRHPTMYSYTLYKTYKLIRTYLTPYATSITCQSSFEGWVGTFIIPSISRFAGSGGGYPRLNCYNITITSTVSTSSTSYNFPKLHRALHTFYIPYAVSLGNIGMCQHTKRIIVPEGVTSIFMIHSSGEGAKYSYIKLPSSLQSVGSISYNQPEAYVVDCTSISNPNILTAGSTNKNCILVVSDEYLDAFKTKFDTYFAVMTYDDYVSSGLQEFFEG